MASKRMKIRLYRFLNMNLDKQGEPFALCDDCKAKQKVPEACYLNLIANDAVAECANCGVSGETRTAS